MERPGQKLRLAPANARLRFGDGVIAELCPSLSALQVQQDCAPPGIRHAFEQNRQKHAANTASTTRIFAARHKPVPEIEPDPPRMAPALERARQMSLHVSSHPQKRTKYSGARVYDTLPCPSVHYPTRCVLRA
jgi:hypothetical protein